MHQSSTPSSTSRFAFNKHRKQPEPNNTDNSFPAPSANSPIDSRTSDWVENVHRDKEIPTIHRTAEHISLSDIVDNGKSSSVSLTGLDKCTVDLRYPEGDGTIPALYLENIKHCLVLAPNIAGSVLIHNAEDCVFVLKCHQFRMHTSTGNKVLLDTDGTPIIEKCKEIKFGTLDGSNKSLDVLDFDAPNAGQAQNWSALTSEDNERLREGTKIMPVGDSRDSNTVSIILKEFGIV